MRTEQAQRVYKKDIFPLVYKHRSKLKEDKLRHLLRIKDAVDNGEDLTPFDITALENYYEIVIGEVYNAGKVTAKHDFKKRLRF